MKKLFILALIVGVLFATSGVAMAVNPFPGNGSILKNPGGPNWEPVKVYKLVRYALRGNSTVPLSAGAAVLYDVNSADGVTVSIDPARADVLANFAGIVAATIPTADAGSTGASDDAGYSNWGYIQVHGPATAKINAGAHAEIVKGAAFYASKDVGLVGPDDNGTDAERSRPGGFFMGQPVAASTEVSVFLVNM